MVNFVSDRPMGDKEPISHLEITPLLPYWKTPTRAVLKEHGADLLEYEGRWAVLFPEGTTRETLFPIIRAERYFILFPDGFWLKAHQEIEGERFGIAIDDQFFPECYRHIK